MAGTFVASAQLNPSQSKRPSPLLVRVYELKSLTAFNKADFMSIYQNDQAALGAELVARDEYMLAPGESKPFAKTVAPDVLYLGVLGAYQDLQHAGWRSSVQLKPGQTQRVVIRAGELAIEAAAVK